MSFRDSVFKVAKSLEKSPFSIEFRNLVNDFNNMPSEEDQYSEEKPPYNGINLFWSFVDRLHLQFHGILLVDDMQEIGNSRFKSDNDLKILGLSSSSREMFEKGHVCIMLFIYKCLEDIKEISPVIADLINPYSGNKNIYLHKEITIPEEINTLFLPAIVSFKSSEIYKTVFTSNCHNVFTDSKREASIQIVMNYTKEIENSYLRGQTEGIRNIVNSSNQPFTTIENVIEAYLILISSLRISLQLACQTFYNSIMGEGLLVLNNDNIINIDEINEDGMGRRYKVTLQGNSWGRSNQELTSLLLINCEPSSGKLKDFGMILGKTSSYDGEFGGSSKFTFVRANNDLNIIENMTNLIIKKGLSILPL